MYEILGCFTINSLAVRIKIMYSMLPLEWSSEIPMSGFGEFPAVCCILYLLITYILYVMYFLFLPFVWRRWHLACNKYYSSNTKSFTGFNVRSKTLWYWLTVGISWLTWVTGKFGWLNNDLEVVLVTSGVGGFEGSGGVRESLSSVAA